MDQQTQSYHLCYNTNHHHLTFKLKVSNYCTWKPSSAMLNNVKGTFILLPLLAVMSLMTTTGLDHTYLKNSAARSTTFIIIWKLFGFN